MDNRICIEKEHSLSPDELLARVVKVVEELNEIFPIDAHWNSGNYKEINFKAGGAGKGATGTLRFTPSRVEIEILLAPIHCIVPGRASIEQEAEDLMTKHFGK
jgi:hypothetical protein